MSDSLYVVRRTERSVFAWKMVLLKQIRGPDKSSRSYIVYSNRYFTSECLAKEFARLGNERLRKKNRLYLGEPFT